MRWLFILLAAGAAVAASVISYRCHLPETDYQQKHRLQLEAEVELAKACTNTVTGLTKILSKDLDIYEDLPSKWTACVVAEYINRVGGLERTNLSFTFHADTDVDGIVHVDCQFGRKLRDASAPVDGLFGLNLGAPLPRECIVLSSRTNGDGLLWLEVVPPQRNTAFDSYSVETTPDSRLVSYIAGYCNPRDASQFASLNKGLSLAQVTEGILASLRQRYGPEAEDENATKEHHWISRGRSLYFDIRDESFIVLSCCDYQVGRAVRRPAQPPVDTKGL